MEEVKAKKEFINLDCKELKKINPNFNNDQKLVCNPVQKFQLKIYAPIYEIKNKLKI
jgi:hypothetical protein